MEQTASKLIDNCISAKVLGPPGIQQVTLGYDMILSAVADVMDERAVFATRLRDLAFGIEKLFLARDRNGQIVFGFEIPEERNKLRDLARAALGVP